MPTKKPAIKATVAAKRKAELARRKKKRLLATKVVQKKRKPVVEAGVTGPISTAVKAGVKALTKKTAKKAVKKTVKKAPTKKTTEPYPDNELRDSLAVTAAVVGAGAAGLSKLGRMADAARAKGKTKKTKAVAKKKRQLRTYSVKRKRVTGSARRLGSSRKLKR